MKRRRRPQTRKGFDRAIDQVLAALRAVPPGNVRRRAALEREVGALRRRRDGEAA